MMLRASVEIRGGEVDLNAVTRAGHDAGESVEGAAELAAFAEAMVTGSAEDVDRSRSALIDRLGAAKFVRAAGVVGNFQRMVRIADATGIPLDGIVVAMSDDFREGLGINDFDGASQSPELGVAGRLGAGLLRRVSKTVLPWLPVVARRLARVGKGD
jgi:hypothetical protein